MGPEPLFNPESRSDGGCGWRCDYSKDFEDGRREIRTIEFRILEESRRRAEAWATADGVDVLLGGLIEIEQFNLAQTDWDPKNMAIAFEKLEELYNGRARFLGQVRQMQKVDGEQ